MLANMRAMIFVDKDEVARFTVTAPNFVNTKAREDFVDRFASAMLRKSVGRAP